MRLSRVVRPQAQTSRASKPVLFAIGKLSSSPFEPRLPVHRAFVHSTLSSRFNCLLKLRSPCSLGFHEQHELEESNGASETEYVDQ